MEKFHHTPDRETVVDVSDTICVPSFIRCLNLLKTPTNILVFMNVTLLQCNYQYVSAAYVAIFRVVRTRIQIQEQCDIITPQLKITQFCLKFTVEY